MAPVMDPRCARDVDLLLAKLRVEIVPFTARQAELAPSVRVSRCCSWLSSNSWTYATIWDHGEHGAPGAYDPHIVLQSLPPNDDGPRAASPLITFQPFGGRVKLANESTRLRLSAASRRGDREPD